MKSIYELCYRTENGFSGNLLFSNQKKAHYYLNKFYKVGMTSMADNSLIENSLIIKRILF